MGVSSCNAASSVGRLYGVEVLVGVGVGPVGVAEGVTAVGAALVYWITTGVDTGAGVQAAASPTKHIKSKIRRTVFNPSVDKPIVQAVLSSVSIGPDEYVVHEYVEQS